MASTENGKSAADIEREIDVQRARVEDTIDELQQRLSPGQLVDELLAYTKGGGGEFVSGLQRHVTANPLPVALLGVSLAWLMAKPAPSEADLERREADRRWDDSINSNRGYAGGSDYARSSYSGSSYEEYPLATISGGSLTRVGHTADDRGRHYSEFSDESGKRWRALADKTGNRAGHFMDDAGNRFRGFADATGEQISNFRDEAGNRFEEASGWASHTFEEARQAFHDARDQVMHQSAKLGGKAQDAGDRLMHEADRLNRTILSQFRDQPLIGGALAFAVGAALGAALPHTRQEDKLMGEASDQLKGKAAEEAHHLYEGGKEKAEELYGQATEKAAELHDQVKTSFDDAARRTDDAIERS
jgi:ElaB/YqjD/DUF883 family membrane-anchored ribosome-binding protein